MVFGNRIMRIIGLRTGRPHRDRPYGGGACVVFFYHPIHLKNPAVSWFKTGETDNRLRHVILPNFIPSRPIEVQTTFSVLGEKWGYACCWVENRAKNVSPLRDRVGAVFENRVIRFIGLRTGRPHRDRPYGGG